MQNQVGSMGNLRTRASLEFWRNTSSCNRHCTPSDTLYTDVNQSALDTLSGLADNSMFVYIHPSMPLNSHSMLDVQI